MKPTLAYLCYKYNNCISLQASMHVASDGMTALEHTGLGRYYHRKLCNTYVICIVLSKETSVLPNQFYFCTQHV